jgi:hypothetical protein
MTALRVIAFLAGSMLVVYTFISATQTFVVPRSSSVRLTRFVFRSSRKLFDLVVKKLPTYEQRDGLMAIYAPLTLLMMVPTWLLFTTIGYTLIFWGLGITPFLEAFLLSGSSILTLGFATADSLLQTILSFTEATIGLILVAMLISYLPTMYAAFSKRETAVSLLEVRAGIPPTAPELIWRLHGFGRVIDTGSFWTSWEAWFTEIDESHTSLAALVFFRSPRANQSWVNAAGAVLDGAALHLSMLTERNAHPALVLRAGNQALRHIADFFRVPYNPDPHFPQDPISVTREEFDEAYDRLAEQGVALQSDRDLAWKNFAGWRVNYDSVFNALKQLTMAPEISWLSDYTFAPAEPGKTGGELRKVK